jgi:hypothetical protein
VARKLVEAERGLGVTVHEEVIWITPSQFSTMALAPADVGIVKAITVATQLTGLHYQYLMRCLHDHGKSRCPHVKEALDTTGQRNPRVGKV